MVTYEDSQGPHPRRSKVDAIPTLTRLTPMAAQRHTKLIRNLRLVVPAIGVALLATYALSATPPRIDREFQRAFSENNTESSTMRFDRPRYLGEDRQGLGFEVSAQAAERDPNTPDLIALENPEAFREMNTEKQAKVRARAGLLNTETNRIDLNDNVQLQHEFGGSSFTFNTEAAEVDLDQNVVSSSVGVTGTGDRGDVSADTVKVYQGEGRAILEGNVRFRINPSTKPDDEKEEEKGIRP